MIGTGEHDQRILAGLSTAVQKCTDRIEGEVAKLQAEVDLLATEEGASELRSALALLTEQLQALKSQEEYNTQELNNKLAAQITSTEELRFISILCCALPTSFLCWEQQDIRLRWKHVSFFASETEQ